jgi:hypothetical protein
LRNCGCRRLSACGSKVLYLHLVFGFSGEALKSKHHKSIVERNTSMEVQTNPIPLACDLTAIGADVRAGHLELARQLVGHGAAEVRELADGYAFRYPAEQFDQVARFVANERLCCPFFTFALEVAPARGPIWLRITGDSEVKEFLRGGLGGERAKEE